MTMQAAQGAQAGASVSKLEQAYALIRTRIEQGVYMPGHRLVLAPIAAELGISAVPVREAIRKLEAEGFITFERHVGAQVALMNESEYVQTMQTLALVEGYATALAAPNLTADHFERARSINETMRETLGHFDPTAMTELNQQFHSVLFEECPNAQILDYVHRSWTRMRVLSNSSFSFAPGRAHQSVNEHDRLLELLESTADEHTIERFARDHRLGTLRAVLGEGQTASAVTTTPYSPSTFATLN